MATAVKPFTTRLRRMAAGAPVSPTDDLSPHRFADLVKAGFIERLPAAAARPRPNRRRKSA